MIDLADAATRRGRIIGRTAAARAPHPGPDQPDAPSSAGTELLSNFQDLERTQDPLSELAVDDILDRALAEPPTTRSEADRTIEQATDDHETAGDIDSQLDDVHQRLSHHHERSPGDVASRAPRGSADLAPGLAHASPRRPARFRPAAAATKPPRSRGASRQRSLALGGLLLGLLVIGVTARSGSDNGSTHPAAVRPPHTASNNAAPGSAPGATLASITAQRRSHRVATQLSAPRSHPTHRIRHSRRPDRQITAAHALTHATAPPAHSPSVPVAAPVQPTASAPAAAPASSTTPTHSTQSVPSFGYQGLLGAGHGNGTG